MTPHYLVTGWRADRRRMPGDIPESVRWTEREAERLKLERKLAEAMARRENRDDS